MCKGEDPKCLVQHPMRISLSISTNIDTLMIRSVHVMRDMHMTIISLVCVRAAHVAYAASPRNCSPEPLHTGSNELY